MPELLVQLNVGKGAKPQAAEGVCPSHEGHEPAAPGAPSERLPGRAEGYGYWRSLNELAGTPEFEAFIHREFPKAASEWHDPVSRRNFLKLMGASLALAGVYGCERGPDEKIVPYVQPPELFTGNRTVYFASAMPFDGYARGVLVESYQGRPIKVEGNPLHPASLGAADTFTQASILNLYDPDRSQNVLAGGQISTWAVFLNQIAARLQSKQESRGAGVRILTESTTSPTLADQLKRFLDKYPQARWHQYQPVNRDNAAAGARQAFGRPVNAVYDFSKAQCILSLDSNFLTEEPGSLRYARQFINGRRLRKSGGESGHSTPGAEARTQAHSPPVWREIAGMKAMEAEATPVNPEFAANRLYVVESTPTLTGAAADHRLPLPPSQVEMFAYAVAAALNVPAAAARPRVPPEWANWAATVAADLRQAAQRQAGASVVIVGITQPPQVHALAHAINAALGAFGHSVYYTEPVEAQPPEGQTADKTTSLQELVADMQRGVADPQGVDTLVIIGGNPAYAGPADIDFAAKLKTFSAREQRQLINGRDVVGLANFSVHLSGYYDETSFNCQWHIPHSHYLEAWGDARAFDGTASIIQPLIAPLYNSRSSVEMIAALLGETDVSGYESLRRYWQSNRPGAAPATAPATTPAAGANNDFQMFWEKSLKDGVMAGSALPQVVVAPQETLQISPPATPSAGGLEVVFRPDPCVWDGFCANNGWLQELPKPLTRTTWENAVYLSPRTAEELGVLNTRHDAAPLVNIRYGGRRIENVPVWVWPGHPDRSVTLHLGYGRERAGRVGGADGKTIGFSAYELRTSETPYAGAGLEIEKTGRTGVIACTQDHQVIPDSRDIVRTKTVAQLVEAMGRGGASHIGAEGGHGAGEHASLYRPYDYSKTRAWGMVIDMNACFGCNACVVACQSENNIPIVGKDQVEKGREMHWIRIDTYYQGDAHNPEAVFQPMLCQHCEQAPCEVVCPVAATTHSSEGINEMTYNRCVGTRYCANNCPYKVRRFNFLQYQDKTTPSLKLMRNPSVTVRDRGVMEKCTYCVQRVNQTRIELEKAAAEAADENTPPEDRDAALRRRHEAMRQLQTACQQSCPTEAIVFGDLNYIDPEGRKSRVARLKDTELNYGVLTELNTQPRTTYLPRLKNPNVEM